MREWNHKQTLRPPNPVLRLQLKIRWFLMYFAGPAMILLGIARWFRWL